MKIISDKAQKVVIERDEIKVIGLANLGRWSTLKIDGPGSFSIPVHKMPGVYAGIATCGLKGNKLQKPLPFLLFCIDEDQKINVKTNDIAGTWILSVKYSQMKIYNSAIRHMSAA